MSTVTTPQANPKNKTIFSIILILYVFAVVYDVIKEPPPYFSPLSPADITYQAFGLILCLLPFLAAPFIFSRQKKSLKQAWSEFSFYQKGLLSLLLAGALKSAYVLSLLFSHSGNDAVNMAAIIITAVILLLKWNGVLLATSLGVYIRKAFLARRAEGKSTAMLVFGSIICVALIGMLVYVLISADLRGFFSMM